MFIKMGSNLRLWRDLFKEMTNLETGEKATSVALAGLENVRECMKNGNCPTPPELPEMFCAKCGFRLTHFEALPWTKTFVLPCGHCKIEANAEGKVSEMV